MELDGAIDLHVHTAPDVFERRLDDDEQTLAALTAGMRAVLLKSHHTLTADRATLASKRHGMPVYGGLTLNLSVGGLNPTAVETAIEFGAKQIWMPTLHARNCLERAEQEVFRDEAGKGRYGITLLDSGGRMRQEIYPILEQVRDADIILGTGHLAPEESLTLLRLARQLGVRRTVVTHPLMSFTRFAISQMRQAVDLGALLEFDYLACSPQWFGSVPPARTAEGVRAVGADRCILATDGGQASSPPPVEMLSRFVHELAREGIRSDELKTMTVDNPAWLLDL